MSSKPRSNSTPNDEALASLELHELLAGQARGGGQQQSSNSKDNSYLIMGDRSVYALFEAALDAMVLVDDQGHYVAANRAACDLFGLPREDLLGCCIADFAPPGFDLEQVWQGFQQQGHERGDFSLVRKDGTIREVEYSATANVIPHYHLSILRDVTERKQLERQLRQLHRDLEQQVAQRTTELQQANTNLRAVNQQLQASQQKYQALFNVLPIGVTITDADGNIIEANPASERILGIPAAAQTQRTYDDESTWQMIRPDGSPMPSEEYASVRALREKRAIEGVEKGIVRPDGTVHWLYVNAVPIPLESYGVAIAYIDITDLKRMELELRSSNERYNRVLQSIGEGVWQWERAGNVLTGSLRFWEILGSVSPLGGVISLQALIDRVHPEDQQRFETEIYNHLQYRSPYEVEIRIRHQAGHYIWIRSRGQAFWNAQGLPLRMLGTIEDISDRKLAEATLKASEERLRIALFAARMGSWDWDIQTNQIVWSESLERLMGMQPGTFDGRFETVTSLIYPADRQRVLEAITRCLEQDADYDIEFRFVKPNGGIRWAVGKGHVLRDVSGQPIRMLGIDVDITDRKLVELSLQQTLQELTYHVENSPLATIRWNREFRIESWSKQAEAIFGWTAEEMVGKSLQDWQFVFEEDLERVQQVVEQLRQGHGIALYNRNYHKDGSIVHCEWYNSTLLDEQGNLVSILSLAQDITARKRTEAERDATEAALRQREQEFRTLAENSPDVILRCDREYRFLYTNPMATTLTGIPGEHFIGKNSLELGFPEHLTQLWTTAMERAFATGEEQSLEYEMDVGSGHLTFYSRVVPELNPDGSVVSLLVVARDITEFKQVQNALLYQSQREHSLRSITQHIRETLDLDAILATAVAEIQRTLQADRTLIFQLNSDHSGMVIQEAVKPEYPVTLAMRWKDECFPPDCYNAYVQGKARIVSDVALDDWGKCLVEFMEQTGVQSKVVAPITQAHEDGTNTLWGLLIVHACRERRVWQPAEADLLQQVADQLAIALQQAELYSQVQKLNANLEQQVQSRTADLQQLLEFERLLRRITDQVRDSLEEDQILETVVRELGQGLQLACCDTGIYNHDLTTSTIAHEFTQSMLSAKGVTFPIAEATHRDIYPFLFQGQTLQFCDRVACTLRPDEGQLTVLVCPIVDDQRVLGDMWLYKKSEFSPSEVRLVEQVVNQCAIALRQSRLYQSAQAQVQELERLNQLKDDFLSTVSHELRTPMSNIKMATQMLEVSLNHLGVLSDQSGAISRYFKVLQEEGQREISLINDLLDLTRLDSDTEPLMFTEIALQAYIPHLAEAFIERTRQQQQQFTLQIPEDLPPITTDLPYLERILTELLHNACKYTPAGERISLIVQAIPTGLEIRISNSGVEIPAAESDRIFDKFYRIPQNDPWKHGGTGLGLALVQKIIDRLGGSIRVESGNNQTTFILEFSQDLFQ